MTTVYFSTEEEFEGFEFRPSEEGIHVELSFDAVKIAMPDLRDKSYIYEADVNCDMKNPLVIDTDILLWNASNLAELFLCKLDDEPYSAAFLNQRDTLPDDVHINILEEDRDILENIMNMQSSSASFNIMFKFINYKGYDCIRYRLWESPNHAGFAYILKNDTDILRLKLISSER